MNGVPCKGCTDRVVGCHADCPKYLEFKRKHEEVLKKQSMERQVSQVLYYNDHAINFRKHRKRVKNNGRTGCEEGDR